ncbi:MAG TPA: DUF4345 family protein [Candidatus Limnocylindria bacterium]|nr:DUF4345 family protein [Candidatus Limnocylindria bacterium]
MNTRAGIGALVVIGLAFCGVGYLGLVAPHALLGPVGIEWDRLGNTAMNELTATYGGMHAALGVFFLLAAFVPALRLGALWAAAAFLSGLVIGRIVSLVRDGIPGPMPLALIVVELMGVLIAVGAVLKRHAPAHTPAAPAPAPTTTTPPL